MKFSEISGDKAQKAVRREFWHRLAFNKWTMTFVVILVVLSACMGLEQADNFGGEDVLYVSDELPYDIRKVSGDGTVEVLPEDDGVAVGMTDRTGADVSDDVNNDKDPAGDSIVENSIEDALNHGLLGDDDGEYSINSDSDFFINYRLERDKVRSRQLEMLQQLIDDEKTDAEVRSSAQAKIIAQADAIEQELTLESILVAKYGGEAAVFIQPEKINLVLDLESEAISDNEAEKIARLVDNYTGVGYENIIIVLKD